MKILLLLILTALCMHTHAQNCTNNALMKKGTQLEYEFWGPKPTAFNVKDAKLSKIIFEVQQVTDSNGSSYSTILKKGIGANNKKDTYQRTIVLECDSKNIRFPFDFYTVDTFFTSDYFSGKGGYFLANTPLVDANTYIIPLVPDGVSRLPE